MKTCKRIQFTQLGIFLLFATALLARAPFARAQRVKIRSAGNDAATHVVKDGDTLWGIADYYYGDPYKWPKLWSLNPEITNPHWIYPSAVLRLKKGADVGADVPSAIPATKRPASKRILTLGQQGYLDKEALEESGVIVGSHDEKMLLSTYDQVYIRFDSEAHKVGDVQSIYRDIAEDERLESERGKLVRVVGSLRIIDVDEDNEIATGRITEAVEPIERNYHVGDVQRNFSVPAPTNNKVDLEGKIVAALIPRKMVAEQQVVFFDRGTKDSVQSGNTVLVVRKGDRWLQSLEFLNPDDTAARYPNIERLSSYPSVVVAVGRVLDARKETSAVLILSAREAVHVGDRMVLRKAD